MVSLFSIGEMVGLSCFGFSDETVTGSHRNVMVPRITHKVAIYGGRLDPYRLVPNIHTGT